MNRGRTTALARCCDHPPPKADFRLRGNEHPASTAARLALGRPTTVNEPNGSIHQRVPCSGRPCDHRAVKRSPRLSATSSQASAIESRRPRIPRMLTAASASSRPYVTPVLPGIETGRGLDISTDHRTWFPLRGPATPRSDAGDNSPQVPSRPHPPSKLVRPTLSRHHRMNENGRSGRRSPGSIDRGERVNPGRPGSSEQTDTPTLHPRRSAERPEVQPVDPASPAECLCGDPADFIVDTNWFSGRRSRDPVCERHVAEVVTAITKKQARRDGG